MTDADDDDDTNVAAADDDDAYVLVLRCRKSQHSK